jgi:hypothetical protein
MSFMERVPRRREAEAMMADAADQRREPSPRSHRSAKKKLKIRLSKGRNRASVYLK